MKSSDLLVLVAALVMALGAWALHDPEPERKHTPTVSIEEID